MKKLYILFLFLGWLLSACDSVKDLQPLQNINDAVPQAAINAIKRDFPEATQVKFSTIEKNVIWESNFQDRVDQMSAIVNNLGEITETYKVSGEVKLPENAKKYIDANYAGATIKKVSEQVDKANKIIGYKVQITTKEKKEVTIVFDATGTLILLITDDRNHPDKPLPPPPPKVYFIEQQAIPVVIRNYLSEKHKDYKFLKAAVIVDGETKTYSIVIAKDMTTFEYLFDEKGNVLKSGSFGVNAPVNIIENKPLSIIDIPAIIKTYLDKEFKGWAFEKGISFSQNDKLEGYNILISYDRKQFSLQFDAKGAIVRKEQVGGSNGPNNNAPTIKPLLPKDLPTVITNFLINKHKEFQYIQLSLVTNKDDKTYWVTILKGNLTYDYTFDSQGKVLKVVEIPLKLPDNKLIEKPLVLKDVPDKIKNYLDKNYIGWAYQKGVVKYVDNKLLCVLVVIKIGNDFYYINFDASLNFKDARKG